MSGMTVERRDHVLMTLRSPDAFIFSTFFARWSSTNGPFFRLRGTPNLPASPSWASLSWHRSSPAPAAPSTPDDHLVGLLALLARTPLGLAPRRHGMAPTGALALATAERVVDGVHRDAAHVRPAPVPTGPS